MGLLYAWTREVEIGIIDCKNDRRGLQNASKRFGIAIQKIPLALSRLQWRSPSQPVLPLHKQRLEGILAVRKMSYSLQRNDEFLFEVYCIST